MAYIWGLMRVNEEILLRVVYVEDLWCRFVYNCSLFIKHIIMIVSLHKKIICFMNVF